MPFRRNFKYRELIRSSEINFNFDWLLTFRVREDLTDQIDGVKDVFEVSNEFNSNNIEIFVDGILQRENLNYVILSDKTFRIPANSEDPKLQIGQDLIVFYFKKTE
jgi:hypothetical protein